MAADKSGVSAASISAPIAMQTRYKPMTRFNILPLFSRSGSCAITCFLVSHFLDMILMRNSTADRSPPMHNCHTEYALDAAFAHAPARAPSRQFEIAECRCQLFLTVLCGVARAVQAVLQQPAHVFITSLAIFWRQLNTNTLLRAGALKYALRTSTNATTFPPRLPVSISDNATFSASSGGVQLWPRVRLVYLRARWASLVVPCQSPPILSRWLPSPSHASTPLGTLVYILWRRMYSTSSRPAVAHSSGPSHPPFLSSQCHPSHRRCSCSS